MTLRRAAWIRIASCWALFGMATGFQVWISMITHGHSVPRLVGYHVAVWLAWLPVTAFILWMEFRYPVVPPVRTNVLLHALAATAISVVHGFYWMGLLILVAPYDAMTAEASELQIAEILFARMPLELILYAVVLGGAIAFANYERYRESALKAARLESTLAESRLHALELQLRPHFLFNTLNAISSLVRSRRNDEAVTMTAGLADLLRYSLDHAGDQCVSLEQELAMLERYLEIERVRFPDRLSFRIEASPAIRSAAVPTLLLQPLVENAVRHGIARSAAPGVVEVRAIRDGNRLQIELFNTGSLQPATSSGIGLENTRQRLHHLYGADGELALSDVEGGVLAAVTIPWKERA